jgi:predicted RNA-binding protein associated with RNAse of E/G family
VSPGHAADQLRFEFIRSPDRRISIQTDLLEATDDLIVVTHELSPSKPLTYLGEVVMDRGYRAVWFLFKDRSYDVGRVYRPDGTWTGYYVDVLEPVRWTGSDPATLEPVIDLFLDLWIAPDGRYVVLDEDEFEEAIGEGILGQEQIAHARRVLRELVEATEQGTFPPDVAKDFRLAPR